MMSQAIQEQLQQIFSLKRSIQLQEQPHTSAAGYSWFPVGLRHKEKGVKAVHVGYHEKKAGVVIPKRPYSSKNWN